MKILSFDVGIKNLAYCILNYNEDGIKIIHWEIISLNAKFSAHINTSGISDLYLSLINNLDERTFLLDTDVVLIEKQPSFNPQMRIIAGCLQTYFYIRGVVDKKTIKTVEFFSPKNKLKCYSGPELDITSKNGTLVKSKYSQTKKLGVVIARIKLEENGETIFKNLFEISKKKDDLSDCYLQALTYILFKNQINQPKVKTDIKTGVKMGIKTGIKTGVKSISFIKNALKEFMDSRKNENKDTLNESIFIINELPDELKADLQLKEQIIFPMEKDKIIDLFCKYNLKRYLKHF